MSRYRFVSTMKAEGFPIDAACEAAEVSTSSYYDWLARSASPTEAEWDEALLVNEMFEIHHGLDDTYGSPRMTDELARRGFCDNHKRIERLMAAYGLYAKDGRRKKVRTTIPDVSAPPLPDLVKRDFSVGAPGERACGDITYVPTDEGWLYVADVEDIGSRRIVGFAMAEHMRTELVSAAMDMAIATRGGDVERMVFHHDRGAQYLSRRVPGTVRAPRHRAIDRAHRVEPRQRGGREPVGLAQTRAREPLPFRLEGRRSPSHHRLDQPLQRRASAQLARQHPADRVGTTALSPNGGNVDRGRVKPTAQIASAALKSTGPHQAPGGLQPSARTISQTPTCPADGGKTTSLGSGSRGHTTLLPRRTRLHSVTISLSSRWTVTCSIWSNWAQRTDRFWTSVAERVRQVPT